MQESNRHNPPIAQQDNPAQLTPRKTDTSARQTSTSGATDAQQMPASNSTNTQQIPVANGAGEHQTPIPTSTASQQTPISPATQQVATPNIPAPQQAPGPNGSNGATQSNPNGAGGAMRPDPNGAGAATRPTPSATRPTPNTAPQSANASAKADIAATDNSRAFLGTEPLGRLMVRLAAPSVVAHLVNLLYNLTDRVFIGHIPDAGGFALAGVGVCLPIIVVITSFAQLAGSGGAPLASIELGKRKPEEANRLVGCTLALTALFAVVLTVVIEAGLSAILPLFGASDATLPYAESYMHIYAIGSFFAMEALAINALLLAQGDSRFALASMGVGAALNIALDALLIFALGMGVSGAALASVISQTASATCGFMLLRRRASTLRPQMRYFRISGNLTRRILSLGVAPFFLTFTEAVIVVVFNTTLKTYGGDAYVGTMTVLQSVLQMVFVTSNGFTQGVQPIISYCYGAGLLERVRKAVRLIIVTCFIIIACLMLLCIANADALAGLFTSDSAIRELTAQVMPLYFSVFTVFGVQTGIQSVFMGLEQGACALAVATVRKLVFMVPLALILPHFFGAWGVFMAEPISDACSITFCCLLFAWRIPKVIGRSAENAENAAGK